MLISVKRTTLIEAKHSKIFYKNNIYDTLFEDLNEHNWKFNEILIDS